MARNTPSTPTADQMVDTAGACAYLRDTWQAQYSEHTLARKRADGSGPPYYRLPNRQVRYGKPDLDTWAQSLLKAARSTTQERGKGVALPDMAPAREAAEAAKEGAK